MVPSFYYGTGFWGGSGVPKRSLEVKRMGNGGKELKITSR